MKSPRPTPPATTRHLSRPVLLLAIGALGFLAPQANSVTRPPEPSTRAGAADPGALSGLRPETRLRKLHLVRPDLIPYPIAYEVYC